MSDERIKYWDADGKTLLAHGTGAEIARQCYEARERAKRWQKLCEEYKDIAMARGEQIRVDRANGAGGSYNRDMAMAERERFDRDKTYQNDYAPFAQFLYAYGFPHTLRAIREAIDVAAAKAEATGGSVEGNPLERLREASELLSDVVGLLAPGDAPENNEPERSRRLARLQIAKGLRMLCEAMETDRR